MAEMLTSNYRRTENAHDVPLTNGRGHHGRHVQQIATCLQVARTGSPCYGLLFVASRQNRGDLKAELARGEAHIARQVPSSRLRDELLPGVSDASLGMSSSLAPRSEDSFGSGVPDHRRFMSH